MFNTSVVLPPAPTVSVLEPGVTASSMTAVDDDDVKLVSPLYCALSDTLLAGGDVAV
jgi:hypothetical protein